MLYIFIYKISIDLLPFKNVPSFKKKKKKTGLCEESIVLKSAE